MCVATVTLPFVCDVMNSVGQQCFFLIGPSRLACRKTKQLNQNCVCGLFDSYSHLTANEIFTCDLI